MRQVEALVPPIWVNVRLNKRQVKVSTFKFKHEWQGDNEKKCLGKKEKSKD